MIKCIDNNLKNNKMTEIENLKKISQFQNKLIDALNKRVEDLKEIKKLKKDIDVLKQIDDTQSESYPIPEGITRRVCLWLNTPAEKMIHRAIMEVKNIGAHPMLTEVIILLSKAKDTLSDYIDAKP